MYMTRVRVGVPPAIISVPATKRGIKSNITHTKIVVLETMYMTRVRIGVPPAIISVPVNTTRHQIQHSAH
jgi:hypothetical protein